MTALEVIVHPARVARERQRRLSDVTARIGFDVRSELVVLRAGGVRTDQHAVATALVDRFDHQLADVLEDVLELIRLTWQIGADRRQDRLFVEVVADDARDVGIDRLVVGNSGTRRIGQRDAPHAVAGEQTRNAKDRIVAKRQRVQEFVVDAPIDHIHPLRAACRAHEHHAVVDEQVRSFDHLHAHAFGQERVLEVRRVVHARREEDYCRLVLHVLRSDRSKYIQQVLGVALDRSNVVPMKDL